MIAMFLADRRSIALQMRPAFLLISAHDRIVWRPEIYDQRAFESFGKELLNRRGTATSIDRVENAVTTGKTP